jgi:hypothetical protein
MQLNDLQQTLDYLGYTLEEFLQIQEEYPKIITND